MMLRPATLVTALVLLTSVAAAPAATATPKVTLSPVDKVYAQAERSLLKLEVYHLKTTTTTTIGKMTGRATVEEWVDVSLGASRSLSVQISSANGLGGSGSKQRALLADNVQWYEGRPASPLTCHHVEPATDTVLGCPFSELKENSKIIHGHYMRRAVPVLVTHEVGGGDDGTTRTTTLTYLDPKTALPLARTENGTYTTDTTQPLHSTTTYSSERLRLSSLPKGFFSPASLGWKAPNPLKGLPHGIPVYWLGRTWVPGGGLPAVTVQAVERPPASVSPFYQDFVQYALASDPYGPVVLTLQLWKAADWAKATVQEPIPLCKPVSQVALTLGVVTFRCPNDGVDGPFGDIDVPAAHITVGAPSLQSAGHVTFSPFATIPAYETVLNALHVRP